MYCIIGWFIGDTMVLQRKKDDWFSRFYFLFFYLVYFHPVFGAMEENGKWEYG